MLIATGANPKREGRTGARAKYFFRIIINDEPKCIGAFELLKRCAKGVFWRQAFSEFNID